MEKKSKDFDDLLKDLGGISRYQILVCAAVIWLPFSTAAVTQIAIFLSAVPEFRCAVPALDNDPSCNLTESEIRNYTIPYDTKTQEYSTCFMYDVNVTSCSDVTDIQPTSDVRACDNGYHYSMDVYGETTRTQWDLVCDRSILDAIATSLFFFGYFLGSWSYGPFSDWFGRKLPLLVYCLLFIVVGVALAFVPIFEVYVTLRVLSAAATIICIIAPFAYLNEMVPKKYRSHSSHLCIQMTTLANIILPLLAYAVKDWHYLSIVCSAWAVPFLAFYYFVPESPRWLLAAGRNKEAKIIVSKIAKSNKSFFSDEDWELVVKTEFEKRKNQKKKNYSLLELFKRPRMRVVSLVVMHVWFTVSLVFYGLALNIGNLSGDPYINSVINASIEILGNAMILLTPWTGKRNTLSASFLFCGLFCLASTVCIEFANGNEALSTLGVALAIMGKLFGTGAFTLIYSITTDLYPTVIRATGLSLGSMAARIGSIFTPFIIEVQTQIPWLTQTIFGTLSVIAFATSLLLPETEKAAVSLTSIPEAEEFYREKMTILNRLTGRKTKREKGNVDEDSYFDNHGIERTAL